MIFFYVSKQKISTKTANLLTNIDVRKRIPSANKIGNLLRKLENNYVILYVGGLNTTAFGSQLKTFRFCAVSVY